MRKEKRKTEREEGVNKKDSETQITRQNQGNRPQTKGKKEMEERKIKGGGRKGRKGEGIVLRRKKEREGEE